MSPYYRPVRFDWWRKRRAYTLFVVRELTSVFIAGYAIVLLLLLRRLAEGREAYEAYLQWLATPGMMAFHIVALAAAVFHSLTWFSLAPRAMAVRIGERRLQPRTILWANYAAWAVVSAIAAWMVLRA
ncbi:MAG: fumarate reductase subunit C [Armatimonadetes bacterium]|nr:fumarate reductase subunit C [Armatimonadota bacterium]